MEIDTKQTLHEAADYLRAAVKIIEMYERADRELDYEAGTIFHGFIVRALGRFYKLILPKLEMLPELAEMLEMSKRPIAQGEYDTMDRELMRQYVDDGFEKIMRKLNDKTRN